MDCDSFLKYFTAFTPSLIGVFVAMVAWQQFKLGRDKIRLDLYARRFAVFERTLAFYNALIGGTAESLQSEYFIQLQLDFTKSCKESQFLFELDTGIYQLLEDLQSRAFKITGFKVHGRMVSDHPETLIKMNDAATEAFEYFDTAIKKIEKEITSYLNFRRGLWGFSFFSSLFNGHG